MTPREDEKSVYERLSTIRNVNPKAKPTAVDGNFYRKLSKYELDRASTDWVQLRRERA